MVIIVPVKPIAIVLLVLSSLILVSYFGLALARGEDPFAVSTGNWQHASAQRPTEHRANTHDLVSKEADAKKR